MRTPRADPIYGGFSHTKALLLSSNVSNTNSDEAPTPSRSGDRNPDGKTQLPSKHRRRVALPGQKQEYTTLFSSWTKGLTWAAQLAEDVLGREAEEVVRRVQSEVPLAQIAEDEGRIVLELEVVLGRRRKLVTDSGLTIHQHES